MSVRVNHIRGTTAEIESLTPQIAELGFDTTKKEPHIGDGATPGGIRLAKKNIREIVTPAQIVAATNDYSPAGLKHAGALMISTDAARDITGLVPLTVTDGTDGREITIYNIGNFNATLKDQNGASAAANRFDLGGSDLVLAPKTSATLRYRNAASRWELVAQTVGSAVGAGAVIARTLAASSQGLSLINGKVVTSTAAGALTIAIKTLAGNDPSSADPVLLVIRNATLATGDYTLVTLTAATTLVISAGSSLGVSNAAAFTLRLVGIDDGGTFRLGVINLGRGGGALPMLRTDQLVTSTAEGGAGGADSANVLYTGTAVAAKPFAMIADLDWSAGLTAAGTWDAAPTQIQLYDARMGAPGHGIPSIARRATGMFNGRIAESRAGNAATFAIKTLSGNDPSVIEPVYATFHDGNGGLVTRTITAALSLTISSGSTLGFVSGEVSRLWLVLVDTGSAVVLGAVNCRDGGDVTGLPDYGVYSTTAEGGAGGADSAQVIYSAAAQASKYICLAGFATYNTGLAAAGTWNAAPSVLTVFVPGMPRPGDVVKERIQVNNSLATGATVIPFDDTIPQNTEGVQFMTVPLAPASIGSVIEVEAMAILSASIATPTLTVALFEGAATSAFAAADMDPSGAGYINEVTVLGRLLASSLLSTSYTLRAGTFAAGTTTFNGTAGARKFGGKANSFIRAREIMA